MDKYETLKNAVLELSGIGEDKRLHNEFKGLIADVDRMEGNDKGEAKPLLTAAEWNTMGYKQRVELHKTNREMYDAAVQGEFK